MFITHITKKLALVLMTFILIIIASIEAIFIIALITNILIIISATNILLVVSSLKTLVFAINSFGLLLEHIYYLIWFKKDQVKIQILINFDSKVNTII